MRDDVCRELFGNCWRPGKPEIAVFKSAYLAIDKTQQVGVNLHICGFQPTVGLQRKIRLQRKMRATPGKRHSVRPVHGGLFSIGLRVTTQAI